MNLKRILFIVALLSLSFIGAGCDFIYGLLDKEGAEEQRIIGKILPYEQNDKVLEAQTILKIYGYSIGTPDGVLGGRTRDILERFQNDAGLKPSRFIDEATWEELHVFEDTGLIKQGQLDVRQIQVVLRKAGFDPGSPDGTMGPNTMSAVKRFQSANKLPNDGKIGYRTLNALSAYGQAEAP